MIISYKWLQTYFDGELPPPEKIVEVLTFGIFEVEGVEKKEDDTILDIKVLPDRAHDCLSHRGIARVLSALLDIPLRAEQSRSLPEERPTTLAVDVTDHLACRRYVGRVLRGITVGPSPDWLRERLEAIGQRSINNIVDATNYVMFDIGQPLHAFDKDKIAGEGIVVRAALASERITTLDGKDVALPQGTLVISDGDAPAGVPLAIAGVKGGKSAQVDEQTSCIILEAANFDPVAVRKTSRGLNILTDSSKRFENELTPEIAREAMDRVTALIVEIAGNGNTVIEEIVDVYAKQLKEHTITLGALDVNRLLGTDMSDTDMEAFFNRLRFAYTKESDPAVFTIAVPVMRLDMREKVDVVEDIAHLFGYANIPTNIPKDAKAQVSKKFYYASFIRNTLVEAGFSEIYSYTFAQSGEIELANPPAPDKEFLRINLSDEIKTSLAHNIRNAELLGLDEVKIFEIGNVFSSAWEHTSLAIGVEMSAAGKKKATILENAMRDILDLLSQKLGVELDGAVGNVWETDLDLLVKELPEPPDTYATVLSKESHATAVYKKISPYPFITRDIAVWVPKEVSSLEIEKMISGQSGELLARDPRLFDTFEKEGRTSYAFRLVFQSYDRTLTDEEANAVMNKITAIFNQKDFQVR